MLKKNLCLILSLLIALTAAACGSDNSKNKVKHKIYLITMDKKLSYWEDIDKGCRQAVEELGGIDYHWTAPNERTPEAQGKCVDEAVSEGANAILISVLSMNEINVS